MPLTIKDLEAMVTAGASAQQLFNVVRPELEQLQRIRAGWRRYSAKYRNQHDVMLTSADANEINGHRHADAMPSSLSLERKKEEERTAKRHADVSMTRWPFDQFWRQFPNKVGKQAALKAFQKVERSGKVSFGDLMTALGRYVRKRDDRPWCNPTTWLNQGRWDDEPAPHNDMAGYNMTGCV
jgi:hypothetical protein